MRTRHFGGFLFLKNMGCWISGLHMKSTVPMVIVSGELFKTSGRIFEVVWRSLRAMVWRQNFGLITGLGRTIWKRFPVLYSISLQQHDRISQLWSRQGWNLNLRRALNDWEIERFITMMQSRESFGVTSDFPERIRWKMNNKEIFSIKSVYWNLNQRGPVKVNWPWKQVWKVKIPMKASCFVW